MAGTLRIPEKSHKDILLVYKYTKAESLAKLETSDDLSLEVDGAKIDTPTAIAKYFVSKTLPELLGTNGTEQAEVEEWLSWVNTSLRTVSKKEVLIALEKKLDVHLASNTFFVGNRLTLVDLIVFGNLYAYTKNIRVEKTPNLLRWFDLIQHMAVKKNDLANDFGVLEINLNDVPEPAVAAPSGKEDKKKAGKGDKTEKVETPEKAEKPKEKKEESKQKGEKKAKKEKKPAAAAAAPVETDQPTVSRLDIRVGYIRSCKKHEGADSLYVEEIDLGDGEGQYRTIVSGLVKWYPLEEMQNRWVICLCNLKPASMRGIKSHGMVLCATAPDGSKVELLAPVDTSKVKPGDRVYFEGLEGEPEKVLNPKKKYWETVQPDFKTNEDQLAYFQDKPFLIKTSSGEAVKCKVATVQGGGIK
ncbi:hypothetical protein EC973_006352 [Apophysomyces ossiformis]|uniref:tRNA-binding domain-containing protein n=1 Tax=Apophysomyces ossiformis TaxID=679940 RepID=A0A8H7BZ62_9FUNG|nr:hypothetical protein EC973_006352 [Apophysomyces ossiformis]